MEKRVYNFSAGPAVLPEEVLLEAQRDLFSMPGVGMSILEMSHRSKKFDSIINEAKSDLKKLLGFDDQYSILFLQGGGTLQFSMVPLNLMPPKNKADYVLTGVWSEKAKKEAEKVGTVKVAASTKAENFGRIPSQEELNLDEDASYVHYTTNNTIYGTEWHYVPEVGNVPLVCDSSSNMLSHPMDVSKYGLIYAGAQKNMGPAGVTLVIVRKDLLERSQDSLHTYLNYRVHSDKDSLYNTPCTFGIYLIGLTFKWLLNMGGLKEIEKRNIEKAGLLYGCIDQNQDYYRGTVEPGSRSLMNVCFRLPNEELEKKFVAEATEKGFSGLKGHRSVGGIRASIYNAFPRKGVEDLVDFMEKFKKNN